MNTIELLNERNTKREFARMRSVLACASKDSTRHVITKVLVETEEDGIIVTATDGQRMRCDRFNLEAEPGIYDIKVSSAKAVFLAKSQEDLSYPNYRQAIPCDTAEASYSISGKGGRFVLWGAVALGCYLDPKLIALGDDEAVTLHVQKTNPNLFPALLKNDATTLVVMPYRIDPQWQSEVEVMQAERVAKAMAEKESEALAA
jgi:hypothetical protein